MRDLISEEDGRIKSGPDHPEFRVWCEKAEAAALEEAVASMYTSKQDSMYDIARREAVKRGWTIWRGKRLR